MKFGSTIRYILLTIYGFITFLFFASSIGLLLNYYLQYSPDKISAELELTLLFTFVSILGGSLFMILFYLLLKEKKEVIILFTTIFFVCFIIFITSVFSTNWNDYREVIFVIGVFVLPLFNLIYLIKRYTNFKFKSLQ